MYIWFPFGLTYLVAIAIGAGLGWLLMRIAYRVFGEAIFVPFELISAAVTFPLRWYRRQRAAPGAARKAEAGETPAGTLREDTIELDEAQKALAGRRKEGD